MSERRPFHAVVVCALEIERAAIARAIEGEGVSDVDVVRSGPGPHAAERAVGGADENASVILLAGLAGALDPGLDEDCPPITHVADLHGGSWRPPAASFADDPTVTVVGVDEVICTPDAKRILQDKSGANLVDTESHGFARGCIERGFERWGVIRAISDRADESLPREAATWINGDGRTVLTRVAWSVLRRPGLLAELSRLRDRSSAALGRLAERVLAMIERERALAAPVTPFPVRIDGGVALLFGGTFDPPHRGHFEVSSRIAEALSERLGREVDVVFVPAARSPLKEAAPIASDSDRVRMLKLGREDLARPWGGGVWTDEIDRAAGTRDPSYTIDTVRRASEILPSQSTLRLLIGADQALDFHRWRCARDIIRLAEPVVMLRAGEKSASSQKGLLDGLARTGAWTDEELRAWRERIVAVEGIEASASAVRAALAGDSDADPVGSVLMPSVRAYIEKSNLYQPSET